MSAAPEQAPAPRFRWAAKNNRHHPVAGGRLMTAQECADWLENDPDRLQDCTAAPAPGRVDCVAVLRPFLSRPVLYLGEHPSLTDGSRTTADPAHVYTGEFPDIGPQNVDDLIVALMAAVERCRMKYGVAVQFLAESLDVEPGEALALVESSDELAELEAASCLQSQAAVTAADQPAPSRSETAVEANQ